MVKPGLAGWLAETFIDSKLTPLIILVSLLLGVGATAILPREEEPQITVPMADVFVAMPGASPEEVEQRVTVPVEKLIRELPGVEYVYSTTRAGESMVVVRFYVGTDPEDALVSLYTKLYANLDRIPPGVSSPLVKARSIDDVPILSLTLSSPTHEGLELRRVAAQLDEQIKQVDRVSETTLIGGYKRQITVELEPQSMAAYGVSVESLLQALSVHNTASRSGALEGGRTVVPVQLDAFLRSKEELGDLVIAVEQGKPVLLKQVARMKDGAGELESYVFHGEPGGVQVQAVTISVAKRPGANAIDVAQEVLAKIERVKSRFLPHGMELTVTRNYGETAAERSNELLYHMGIAVASVTILMGLALGRRESLVVAVAIPVTLALTLATFVLYDFTLNRVTFFALIFSIGILVDDAIVVVENVVRHLRLPENRRRKKLEIVLEAVEEVGNPTILATFTVVAAILPMAFVRGLMGPYMLPIPLGASAAMLFSMLVAFSVVPWAAMRLLGEHDTHGEEEKEDLLTRAYRRMMGPLISHALYRWLFLVGIVLLLLGALAMIPLRLVIFKMLPFDNKSEFQILIDTPEGTTLEATTALATAMGRELESLPELENYQIYVGTSGPYNFNGLVRRYFLRSGPNVADIQVNLKGKHDRTRQSHEIAVAVRPRLKALATGTGAVVQVAEIPPGPPVLQTLVTEVYGPENDQARSLAETIRTLYESTDGVVDVDWYQESPHQELWVKVDREKAARSGVSEGQVRRTLDVLLKGETAGLLHDPKAREEVPIVVRFSRAARASKETFEGVRLITNEGRQVEMSEVTSSSLRQATPSIYHKNLQRVIYVTGDVAGGIDSPLYSIIELGGEINRRKAPDGKTIATYLFSQPPDTEHYSIKWDGEWQVTYEVFRDLGIAFAVVLVLIYALIVGWFQSFLTPLVILSAIPFSLVGIMPAHAAAGAFFTATSMIGFIAGAGIVVRNSIILVDFIELRLAQGMPLEQAVVDAGAVRFRPMLLTAAAVVVGSAVILADPIFNGLAISLMAGEVASLLLSRTAVPVLYYMLWHRYQR